MEETSTCTLTRSRVSAMHEGPPTRALLTHVRRTAGWVFCRRAFRLPNGAGERGHSADLGRYWPDPARQGRCSAALSSGFSG